jgi:hypothetical protein
VWHPPARGADRAPDALHRLADLVLDPGLAGAGAALVRPDVPPARELREGTGQHQEHGLPLRGLGAVDPGLELEALAVPREVAPAAGEGRVRRGVGYGGGSRRIGRPAAMGGTGAAPSGL